MAAGLRAAPGDDVRAVLAALADRPEELLAAGQRLAEGRTEPGGLLLAETVRVVTETEEQVVAVRLDARGIVYYVWWITLGVPGTGARLVDRARGR